jgi:hypothetical protein
VNSIGAIIVACFAVFWVAAGAQALGRRWFVLLLAIAIVISGTIVFAAIHLPFGRHSGGFNGRVYGIFVTLDVVAILIAVVLLKRVGAKQFVIPVIALIVGAHFLGMVPALQSNDFWWVGGAMCALLVATTLILPQSTWAPVVGVGYAAILWLSALRAFF